jgi:hypothetical protein
MTDDIQHIDIDAPEYDGSPKALRDHVKKLQDAHKALQQERDTYKGQVTSAALGDVLAGYKNPERVKRDLLSDSIDPLNREAVEKWLGENGDDYAKGAGTSAPAVSSEDAAAHQRLQETQLTSPADMTVVEAAMAEITPDMSGAEVKAIYRKHGL